jgi:predicted NAD/FAD-dependent oxidoreductase
MKVAIVGAGVSGLSLAYFLLTQNSKTQITVFEKASSLGGRMATRRIGHNLHIDTGCQYLSFDHKEILDFLLKTVSMESLKALPQPILCLPDGWVVDPGDRYYFPNGMSTWCQSIAEHLARMSSAFQIKLDSKIQSLQALLSDGFEQIFVSIPGNHALDLGAHLTPEYQSCMTLIFSWNSAPREALDHFAYRDLSQREGITWLAHEGLKTGHPEIWLAQVSSKKAQELERLKTSEGKLEEFLFSDLEAWIPKFSQGEKTILDSKFWKHAFPVSFVDPAEQKGFEKLELHGLRSPVYFCGDGYLGVGRVENAIQSALLTAKDFSLSS